MQVLYAEPIPPLGAVPCGKPSTAVNCTASPSLCGSSCLARQLNTTLVVGGVEDHPCDPATYNTTGCPADGRQLFNIALAFGPDGTLLAKYVWGSGAYPRSAWLSLFPRPVHEVGKRPTH